MRRTLPQLPPSSQRVPEWGTGHTGAKSPNPRVSLTRRPARGPAPSRVRPGHARAASVFQKSPPPLPRPRSPSAAAVTGRGAAGSPSKQAREHRPSPAGQGALTPDPGEEWEPPLAQDPAPARGLPAPAPAGGRGPFTGFLGQGREPPGVRAPTLPPFSRSTAVSL